MRAAEQLVRDEPQNIFAWGTLFRATRQNDPDRAAQAAREIKRLNPLGARLGDSLVAIRAPASTIAGSVTAGSCQSQSIVA